MPFTGEITIVSIVTVWRVYFENKKTKQFSVHMKHCPLDSWHDSRVFFVDAARAAERDLNCVFTSVKGAVHSPLAAVSDRIYREIDKL